MYDFFAILNFDALKSGWVGQMQMMALGATYFFLVLAGLKWNFIEVTLCLCFIQCLACCTLLMKRYNSVVSETHSACVGNNLRDTIKTVIISFITISLTGEPNSPFSFNLPNWNFGLGPYLKLQEQLNINAYG